MLIARVARLYYEHGLTHQEIADSLGISRIRVTRLLAEARASGLVQITVLADDTLFADEERALVSRFHLKQAWVAPRVADAAKSDNSFATVGAEALGSLLDANSTVAVAVSTAVALVADAFPKHSVGGSYVPLAGSTAGLTTGSNPHEIAMQLAARTGGRAFYLPAPLIAASPEAATLATADPGVRQALAMAAAADIMVSGVGSVTDDAGLLFPSLSPKEKKRLHALGAVGDVAARFFDEEGRPIAGELDESVVGLSLEQIRAIPSRLAIVRGANKVEALRVALSAGLVNMLVTDTETAAGLLAAQRT